MTRHALSVYLLVFLVLPVAGLSAGESPGNPGAVAPGQTLPARGPVRIGDPLGTAPSGWADVKAYGAKGDGVTDDTAAIQKAISTIAKRGGGIVYFPPGTYKFTSLKFDYTGHKGGWVTLLLDGTWSPQKTILLNSVRYAIVGIGDSRAQAFYQTEPSASILANGLNPVVKVTNGPVYIKGITINNFRGNGLVYHTTFGNPASLTLENVYLEAASDGLGSPLKVVDTILLRAFRCTFVGPSKFRPRAPAVAFEAKKYQVADNWMRDIYLVNSGIAITGTKNKILGHFVFDDFLLENLNTPFLIADASKTDILNITINHLWNADCQPGGCGPLIGTAWSRDHTKKVRQVRIVDEAGYNRIVGGDGVDGLEIDGTMIPNFPTIGQKKYVGVNVASTAVSHLGVTQGIYGDTPGFKHVRITTGRVKAGGTAEIPVNWKTPFADGHYTVSAIVQDGSGSLRVLNFNYQRAAAKGIRVRVRNDDPRAAHSGTLDVIAIHD